MSGTVDKEWRTLLSLVEADPRFTITKQRRGSHLKISKDGRLVTTAPGTPSDRRGRLNLRATLRREGLEC